MPVLMMLRALPWRLISYAALAIPALMFWSLWQYEQERSAKFEAQAISANRQLQDLAVRSAQRQAETERRLEEARRNVRTVERVVTKLRDRPITGKACETPDLSEWKEVL